MEQSGSPGPLQSFMELWSFVPMELGEQFVVLIGRTQMQVLRADNLATHLMVTDLFWFKT